MRASVPKRLGGGCKNSERRNGGQQSLCSSAPCQSLQGNILGVGVRTRLLTVAGLKPLESLWAPLLLRVVSQGYGRERGVLLVSTAGRHGKDWVPAGTNENKLASLSTFQVISTFHH